MTRTKDQTDLALRDAIGRRDAAGVQALLHEGADLTTIDDKGQTPLMVAAEAQARRSSSCS
jgi:ankyrin repeat protein